MLSYKHCYPMADVVPRKGDIIINPRTNRPVRVGSRTWLKLVKDGVIQGRYQEPDELYEIQDGTDVEQMKTQFDRTLPKGKHAVRGRGRFKGKLVVRNKRMNPKEVQEATAKAAYAAVRENMDELVGLEGEELEAALEKMILTEMLAEQKPARKQARRAPQPQYSLEETKESEDEEEPTYERSDTHERGYAEDLEPEEEAVEYEDYEGTAGAYAEDYGDDEDDEDDDGGIFS